MPLDPTKVSLARDSGLSIVCATCDRYWTARERGVPGGGCISEVACGSPLMGDTFSNYCGPMTQFDQFCFACGDSATKLLRVKGHVRPIGCCDEHEKNLVRKLKPENGPSVNLVVHSDGSEESSDELSAKKEPLIMKFRSSDGEAT